MVRSGFVLLVVLALYWLALSGYFDKTILLVTGSVSVVAVVGLAARMKILDSEAAPYIFVKAPIYYIWLFKEIIKANMTVVKAVMSPNMEISPSLFKVPMPQTSDMGRTVFANSITLTPGTISVELEDGGILVHALLDEMTDQDGFVEMSERAGWAVGDSMGRGE